MKRLYKTYAITVTKDGEKKIIKLNGNVNSSNYKTMVDTYKKTKEKFSNEDCTVELVGVNDDSSLGNTIFSKQFCQEKEDNSDLLTTTDDIITEIKYLVDLLQRKQAYHVDMSAALSKEQDLLLHKVENFSYFKGDNDSKIKEKLSIFKELETVRGSRRFNKTEQGKLNSVFKYIDIKNLSKKLSTFQIPIKENYDYLNDEKVEQLTIFKKIKYVSDKERQHYMRHNEGKYERIMDDKVNKTLVCYNYGYFSREEKVIK